MSGTVPMREHTLDGRSWRDVAAALQEDSPLVARITSHLASHDAVFWECQPVSRATAHRPFTYVVVPSRAVARLRPDPTAFRDHLRPGAATFRNLGGDAVLVAPGGAVPASCTHIAAWAQTTPEPERAALWAAVGAALEDWWSRTDAPVWVSTSGLGVPWLHVRLDQRPKYVTHRPYRRWPQRGGDATAPPST